MLAISLPFLMTLSLLRNAAAPEEVECEDVQRIELSQTPRAPREVCVSPGLMTGFFFETPVSVELQEELRFAEVSRGPMSISVMPPRDMAPGERLRLSARYLDGSSQEESITLLLVASSGPATRQVEVFRDTRTRDSFERELRWEQDHNRKLLRDLARAKLEIERLREQSTDPYQLHGLVISGSMTPEGVRARDFKQTLVGHREHTLMVTKGVAYRSEHRMAIALWLVDSSPEPWKPDLVKVTIGYGVRLGLVSFWQQEEYEMNAAFLLIIELQTPRTLPSVECTLDLRVGVGKGITLAGIEIP